MWMSFTNIDWKNPEEKEFMLYNSTQTTSQIWGVRNQEYDYFIESSDRKGVWGRFRGACDTLLLDLHVGYMALAILLNWI